ncbi:MAG: non-ribosomal peptide synthetase [Desulfovibrio sp.]|uniref:non-ribosomal peptide synthetase n=1 Tax=Desulfovibrio sp. TaxID=885 RepID=UPI0039E28B8F
MSDQPAFSPLLRRLDRIVTEYGATPAVIDDKFTLSYAQLDQAADALAQELVRRGSPVTGLYLERSAESILAVMAAAKGGITYVPLGLDWPDARIERVITRCGIKALFANPENMKGRDWSTPLWQCAPGTFFDKKPHAAPLPNPDADAALYIMHTSGSTGEPKGARISHAGIYSIFSDVERIGYWPGRIMTHGASMTFDMSIMEVWGGLLNGCSLVITDTQSMLDSAMLEKHLIRYGVELLLLPTSVFNVVSAQNPQTFRRLKSLCFGGEMPNRETIRRVREACPGLELHNCYGPTECSVMVATETITEDSLSAARIPAGRALGDTNFLIMDDTGRTLPAGEEGELFICGTCVGLGYVKGTADSSQAFTSRADTGERLYRTGDRAVLDEAHVLTILGRNDDQIKISGCRVEPGEISAAIMAFPEVHAVHVGIVKEPHPELAAYVVPGHETTDDNAFIARLKAFLTSQVPEHMIPRHILLLDELPLRASGKVDTSRLPAPHKKQTVSDDAVLDIFRTVLADSSFSSEDSFLEAGGSSIMAARLIAALREFSGVAVPFHLIMEPRTAAIANLYIENAKLGMRQHALDAAATGFSSGSEITARI